MDYTGISLSSGGTRGLFMLGALHAAQLNGKLNNVKYYAGTSIGSVIGLLLAVGWDPLEMFTYLCTEDISKAAINYHNIDLQGVVKKYGLIDIKDLRAYLQAMIVKKWGGIPTFAELQREGKILICCAYRLRSTNPTVYFSYKTHPNMSTLDAVILSSSIPLVFQAQLYNDEYYIDGGCVDRNPTKYLQQFIKEEEGHMTNKILSLEINDKTEEYEEAQDSSLTFFQYVKEIVLLSLISQPVVTPSEFVDVINLKTTTKHHIMAFKLTNSSKIQWFCSGLSQGIEYFKELTEASEESNEI